jgi:N-glycosylase/DNA lyase
MSQRYGRKVGSINGREFYSFPTVEALADDGVEKELFDMSFGYRAKFVHRSALSIRSQSQGVEWLYRLRQASYEDAHQYLQQLPGIGAKVADCVCLMSLDKLSTVPVDTHVWQIALRDYGLKTKGVASLTPKTYHLVREKLQSIFGPFAGWAHTVSRVRLSVHYLRVFVSSFPIFVSFSLSRFFSLHGLYYFRPYIYRFCMRPT